MAKSKIRTSSPYLSLDGLSIQYQLLSKLYTYVADKLDKESNDHNSITQLKSNVSDELKNNKLSDLSKYLLKSALEYDGKPLEDIVGSFNPKKDQNRYFLETLGVRIQYYEELSQAKPMIQQLKNSLDKCGKDKRKAAGAFRYVAKELSDMRSEIETLLA